MEFNFRIAQKDYVFCQLKIEDALSWIGNILPDVTVLGEMNPPLEVSQQVNCSVRTNLFRIIHCADESRFFSVAKK